MVLVLVLFAVVTNAAVVAANTAAAATPRLLSVSRRKRFELL